MRPASSFSRRPSTLANLLDIHQLIDECSASLRADPACLHTLAIRGHACVKAKLWDLAIRDFSEILNCRPEDIHGRFSRGMAFFKNGQIESAHKDFSRVLELNPHHVMARYARAGCYNTEGEFHEAILDYAIALEHDEKEHESAFRMEKSYHHRRRDSGSADSRGQQRRQLIGHHHHSATAGATSAAHATRSPDPIHLATSPPLTATNASQVADPISSNANALCSSAEPKMETPRSVEVQKIPGTPVMIPSSQNPVVAAQVSSRAGPRKVVQVRVNLSEFADASCRNAIEQPASAMSSNTPSDADQQRVGRVQRQDCYHSTSSSYDCPARACAASESSNPARKLYAPSSTSEVSVSSSPATFTRDSESDRHIVSHSHCDSSQSYVQGKRAAARTN